MRRDEKRGESGEEDVLTNVLWGREERFWESSNRSEWDSEEINRKT